MKNLIKSILPREFIARVLLWRRPRVREKLRRLERGRLDECYRYDIERFWKYSPGSKLIMATPAEAGASEEQLAAMMTLNYHSLEKGLAHPEPRPGFGKEKVAALCQQVDQFVELFGYKPIVHVCLNALSDYAQHAAEGGAQNSELEAWLQDVTRRNPEPAVDSAEATTKVSRADIHAASKMNLAEFFANRHSIRNFSSAPVAISDIRKAVAMASKSPSVCNRQSAKVYIVDGAENRARVLALQSGNRGFGHAADKVLIVTSDTQTFLSFEERNQCWVDGGLFAMSLIYALHSLGLGTCCLNWCTTKERDRQLKERTGIADSEAVIMMIAVGHIAEQLLVARSRRKSPDELMVILPSVGG
jgi:nitroreductase